MKKLITMMAFAVAAVYANAAAVGWYIYTDSAADYTAYVFTEGNAASTLAAYLTSENYEDSSAFTTALSSHTKTVTTLDSDGYGDGTTDNVGEYISVLLVNSLEAGSTLYYADSISTDGYVVEGAEIGEQLGIETFSSGTIAYKTSPVPEPTSGLLMLLGVAGLALRRKHT